MLNRPNIEENINKDYSPQRQDPALKWYRAPAASISLQFRCGRGRNSGEIAVAEVRYRFNEGYDVFLPLWT